METPNSEPFQIVTDNGDTTIQAFLKEGRVRLRVICKRKSKSPESFVSEIDSFPEDSALGRFFCSVENLFDSVKLPNVLKVGEGRDKLIVQMPNPFQPDKSVEIGELALSPEMPFHRADWVLLSGESDSQKEEVQELVRELCSHVHELYKQNQKLTT